MPKIVKKQAQKLVQNLLELLSVEQINELIDDD